MKKNEGKITVAAILIVILLLIIAGLCYVLYDMYNAKIQSNEEVEKLNAQVEDLNEKNEQYENKSNYLENFSDSVSKELGEDNNIILQVNSDVYGINFLIVNNKGEAFIVPNAETKLESLAKIDEKLGKVCKIAKDVSKIYWCETGQDIGDDYIIMIKNDGNVEYIKFDVKTEESNVEPIIDLTVNKMENVSDITDVITINGNDENGIGGLGFLLIKSDGTAVPYFTID